MVTCLVSHLYMSIQEGVYMYRLLSVELMIVDALFIASDNKILDQLGFVNGEVYLLLLSFLLYRLLLLGV